MSKNSAAQHIRQPWRLGRASVPPTHTQNSLTRYFVATSGLCGAPASRLPPAQPALSGCVPASETSAAFRWACFSRRRSFRSVWWGFRRQVRGACCRGGTLPALRGTQPPPPAVPPRAARVACGPTGPATASMRLMGPHGRRCGR